MRYVFIIFVFLFFWSCSPDSSTYTPKPVADRWLVPEVKVIDGGPGKDGIASIQNPLSISVAENIVFEDEDLIIGVKIGSEMKAYPHGILNYHEAVNDVINNQDLLVAYCPLTGTGFCWNREFNQEIHSFGNAGLLYNSNQIMFDRTTDSYWSQILGMAIHGEYVGRTLTPFPIIETTWKTWKEMYPETKIMSHETGFQYLYSTYPYLDYQTNNEYFISPVDSLDPRLPAKERVHAIMDFNQAFVYRFDDFGDEPTIINDLIESKEIFLIGSKEKDFILSFERRLEDGTRLDFSPYNGQNDSLLIDNEGNIWNGFGEAIDGPRKGKFLKPTNSMMSFWFAVGTFFQGARIYN